MLGGSTDIIRKAPPPLIGGNFVLASCFVPHSLDKELTHDDIRLLFGLAFPLVCGHFVREDVQHGNAA